jgi:hypothetical protein
LTWQRAKTSPLSAAFPSIVLTLTEVTLAAETIIAADTAKIENISLRIFLLSYQSNLIG